MEFLSLISPAYAQGFGGAEGLGPLLPLILIFVVFWFLLIRPQQRKAKEHRELLKSAQTWRPDRHLGGDHRQDHQGRFRYRASGGDRRRGSRACRPRHGRRGAVAIGAGQGGRRQDGNASRRREHEPEAVPPRNAVSEPVPQETQVVATPCCDHDLRRKMEDHPRHRDVHAGHLVQSAQCLAARCCGFASILGAA